MQLVACLLMSLCVGLASNAFADQPAEPSSAPQTPAAGTPPAHASTAPAAPGTSVAPSDAANDTAAADSAKRDAANDKLLRGKGYKPEAHNGRTLYCRKEAPLGSRFENKVCNTAEDLLRITQDAQDRTSEAQQRGQMTPNHN
jgi:hypothetical protein